MSRAKAVVEAAAFTWLSSHVTRATVYQDAPLDARGDLVILGDMKSARLPGKIDGGDRRVSLAVIAIASAEERAPLLAIQEEIETLDGQSIVTADGWQLAFTFEDDDAGLAEDGSEYVGMTSFAVFAIAP